MNTDPSAGPPGLTILTPGRGRPRGEPHTTASTWIPVTLYNRLNVLAKQQDQSVSELIHALLQLQVK